MADDFAGTGEVPWRLVLSGNGWSSLNTVSVNDTVPAMNSIGQIAADRANGVLTGPISADYVTATIRQFATMQAANRKPGGDA